MIGMRALGGVAAAVALVAVGAGGCAHGPKTQEERTQLQEQARAAEQAIVMKDPSVQTLINQSAGYIVFPEVKEGGFIVGGAGAKGVVFDRNGAFKGFAELSRASVGAQVGGQKYAEMIIVRDQFTLDKILAGDFDLGAGASAVILREGAAAATTFGERGVAVVVNPIAGAMVNVSLSGQQIKRTM
jgi:lipid-binding SYLF domain-containing protein